VRRTSKCTSTVIILCARPRAGKTKALMLVVYVNTASCSERRVCTKIVGSRSLPLTVLTQARSYPIPSTERLLRGFRMWYGAQVFVNRFEIVVGKF
jgi:hypothetical protein